MTFDHFDQFEAYIENALPAAERQALEQQLAENAPLRAELADYQQFRFSLESVTLKQQLRQIHIQLEREGELDNRPPMPRQFQRRRLRLAWAGLAFVVLILTGIGLYWQLQPTHPEKLFQTYYQPEPTARGENDCGPELAVGIQSYRSQHYQQALEEFGKLTANKPCVRYYRGLAQLALGNSSVAITELEQTMIQKTTSDEMTRQKNEWYLALAYLKANRPEDAHRLLTTIAGQSGHPFQRVARQALADLDHA